MICRQHCLFLYLWRLFDMVHFFLLLSVLAVTQVDIFHIECPSDVGDLLKVRLWHDNSGFGSDWHVDRVEICKRLSAGFTPAVVFPCQRWLAKGKGDGLVSVDLLPDEDTTAGAKDSLAISSILEKGSEDEEDCDDDEEEDEEEEEEEQEEEEEEEEEEDYDDDYEEDGFDDEEDDKS